jgi:prophage antirepressor-like protein
MELKNFKFEKTTIRVKQIEGMIYFSLLDLLAALKKSNNAKKIQEGLHPKFLKVEGSGEDEIPWINELGLYYVVCRRDHAESFIDYIANIIYPKLRGIDRPSLVADSSAEDEIKKIEKIISYHRKLGSHFMTSEEKMREIILKDVREKMNIDLSDYLNINDLKL